MEHRWCSCQIFGSLEQDFEKKNHKDPKIQKKPGPADGLNDWPKPPADCPATLGRRSGAASEEEIALKSAEINNTKKQQMPVLAFVVLAGIEEHSFGNQG
jgi:hypothetical protein